MGKDEEYAEFVSARWLTLVRAALALGCTLALILGGVVVQQVVAGEDATPAPDEFADLPGAPDGQRWAGMGRVVVAVPESWGNDHECAPDVIAPATACQQGEESTPTLSFFDLEGLPHHEIDGPVDRTYHGVDVLEGPLACPPTASCVAPMPYAVHIPGEGVGFIVGGGRGADPRLQAAIIDSLRVLPAGFTTVPYLRPGLLRSEAEEVLGAAGLEPYLNARDVDLPLAGTDPAAGSVVRVASTVTLLPLASGESGSTSPSALTCPTARRSASSPPFFNESAPGAATPEAAVEVWLDGPMGRSLGPGYVMDEDHKHAWVLRADGTAEARVRVKLTAGGGYFYYGHEACG